MSQPTPQSPWQTRLVREIGIILLIKLAILLTLKAVWFTEPTVPVNGSERVSERLFGPATQP
ncbi:cytochrome oxidase putative small subunit CydP [Pseudomonas sp. RL]|uniref:cytochrome oxidase putative small subunit CydP n=1 Tax=Pseudomonas sp. RL TaxID=1452718 RepID=UPI0004867356|nr:cytochrome oxidase putative small subunit CydP [Pseudomonas sp. RL]